MKKLLCVLLDDDALALAQLQNYVLQIPEVEVVGAFSEPMAAYQCLVNQAVDLLVTDINMPTIDGLAFVRGLKNPPYVIFQTSYGHYAVESYEVEAVDFLIKPYSFERLWQAVEKVRKRVSRVEHEEVYFFVKAEGGYVKLLPEEVLYIEAYQNYVKVFLTNDVVVVRMSMRKVEEQFPPEFIRIHRSLIVNIKHIAIVKQEEVVLNDGKCLMLGKHFYEEVKEKVINQHLLNG